jgi:hypothetical protein
MVSRLFGKLEAHRHFISGMDCAIAGAAKVLAARPTPADWMNVRRFMLLPPIV